MKKIAILVLVLLASLASYAQTNDYTIRSVRDPVQLVAKINADMTAVDARLDTADLLVQRDTNTTTTASAYTAPQANALLFGQVGSSNAVWISTASGTNSWSKWIQQK